MARKTSNLDEKLLCGLTQKQLYALVDLLNGTQGCIETTMSLMGLDPGQFDVEGIEDALMGESLERCGSCGLWTESCDMAEPEPLCEDCSN